jgi:hypothetical protein
VVTDEKFTTEERRWLAVWEEKLKQVADGTMTADDVMDWAWKKKVLNAINVTVQRIKRSERPGHDPRRHDNTWVTVAAERGRQKDDLSLLAQKTVEYVVRKLEKRGHAFDVDWMATSSGVVVVSINVKALREFMHRRPAAGRHHGAAGGQS